MWQDQISPQGEGIKITNTEKQLPNVILFYFYFVLDRECVF